MKIKPPASDLFYVTIDGTRAIDSVALGQMWQKFGWKNLLGDLKAPKTDLKRRTDAAHAGLPVRHVAEKQNFAKGGGATFADVVIMPEGRDGTGLDDGNWTGKTAVDNAAQINAANTFVQSFILSPRADPAAGSLGAGTHVADLVYVSSHGVRTGDMFGEASNNIDEVDPFFIVAKAAGKSGKFDGVKWLILSNCNTMVAETHNDWLTLMKASPSFRGIIGYHGTSVAADASSAADVSFVKLLEQGKSLREAWRQANVKHGMTDRWVIICHDAAKDDTIQSWNDAKLTPVPSGAPVIKLFDEKNQSGVALAPQPDPFAVFWSKTAGATTAKITPANRYDKGNKIKDGDDLSITIGASSTIKKFVAGTVVEVTLIFVREDYPEPIDVGKMFTIAAKTGIDPAVTTKHKNTERTDSGDDTWVMKVTAPVATVTLGLKVKKLFLGAVHHNLPFWLKAEYTAPDGSGQVLFDFIHDGAIYAS
jgi:hypothetical protein